VKRVATSVVDPDVGTLGSVTYTTVYSGACKVQQPAAAGAPTTVGEAEEFVGQMRLDLPLSDPATANVAPDDLVTITACQLDASLVNRTFRLRGPSHKSYATARRLPMVEVSG
jgi:hypothetical protein